MPHDRKGELLKVGDRVVIPGVVTQVIAGSDFCNVTVESEDVMPGNGTKSTFSSLNTKQVEKVLDEQH